MRKQLSNLGNMQYDYVLKYEKDSFYLNFNDFIQGRDDVEEIDTDPWEGLLDD